MRVLPVPFSPPMSRALLDGTKTQTRRALRGEFHRDCVEVCRYSDEDPTWVQRNGWDGSVCGAVKVPYAVGDLLWVREHWRAPAHHDAKAPSALPARSMTLRFEAGGFVSNLDRRGDYRPIDDVSYGAHVVFGRLRQGMHLPRWASRTTLEVSDVRVQRLQEISEADAIAEGCRSSGPYPGHEDDLNAPPHMGAVENYEALWEQINGPGSWDANPWVAAYSFTVHRKNVDDLIAELASEVRP